MARPTRFERVTFALAGIVEQETPQEVIGFLPGQGLVGMMN
jgi:hypothetical protein